MSEAHENVSVNAGLVEGRLIGNKYRLVRELGVGGMGVVWSATHLTLGHRVAVKFLLSSSMDSEEARIRFDREARLAARLGEASRHITRVIDHGVSDDRVPYLVMELLRGESLSARLKRERRLPLVLAAQIVQQLSRALHVAHSAGVVHRDLKPANIFLCTPEQGDDVDVKLLDFGIAKATADTSDSGDETTRRGQLLGTPSYMSPEQILNDKPVDCRADLWAVAAIVYRMVVGRSPFGTGPIQEIGIRVMSLEPLPPSTIWPELPRELDNWIERGLAKNPEVRFQNARELSDFLAAVAGTSSSKMRVAGPTLDSQPDERTPQSAPTVAEAPARARARRGPAKRRRAAIGALCVLGALVVGAMFVRARRSSNTAVGATVPTGSASLYVEQAISAPTQPPSASTSVQVPLAVPSSSARKPMPKVVSSASAAKGDGSGWGNKQEL